MLSATFLPMHGSVHERLLLAQVKAKVREVQLHRDSPLGDTLLECYSCGSRNTFALGFVPVKSENSVVLLCRDHPASASGIKELNLDLTLWQPLIEDRAFMPWLVKQPTQQVLPATPAHYVLSKDLHSVHEAWSSACVEHCCYAD